MDPILLHGLRLISALCPFSPARLRCAVLLGMRVSVKVHGIAAILLCSVLLRFEFCFFYFVYLYGTLLNLIMLRGLEL